MKAIKSLTIIFFSLLTLTLSACSDGDSSTQDSSADVIVTTESGAVVSFASDEITAGEVAELIYDLGGDEFTATIHWDDGTTSRVRGSGAARHGYDVAGTYSVAIQVDGFDGERIGDIEVIPDFNSDVVIVDDTKSRIVDDPKLGSAAIAVSNEVVFEFPGDNCTLNTVDLVEIINLQELGQGEFEVRIQGMQNGLSYIVVNQSTSQLLVGHTQPCDVETIIISGLSFFFEPNGQNGYKLTVSKL